MDILKLKLGLKAKLTGHGIIMILLISLLLSWFVIRHEKTVIHDELRKRGLSLAKNLAYNSEYGVLIANEDILLNLINGVMKEDDIIYCLIQDQEGQVLAKYGKVAKIPAEINQQAIGTKSPLVQDYTSSEKEQLYDIAVPVTASRKKVAEENIDLFSNSNQETKEGQVGIARVGISLRNANLLIIKIRNQVLILTLIIITICAFIIAFIINPILNPVKRLAKGTGIVSKGDLTYQVSIDSTDEIGQLSKSFNKLTESLRQIIVQIREAGLQITTSVSQIQSSAEEQASGADEQASGITEVSSTIEELATTASHIAENAKNVAEAADRTLAGIQEINSKVGQTSKKILILGDKSQSIGKITSLIDDIAEETNLLALNAAIEAARAGEAGRGFAVVAQEVRKLAERSSESTEEIRQLISEIQSETNSTIIGIEDSTKWVTKGLEMMKETTQSAKEISLATQQQRSASEQVVQAIQNIGEVTKQFVGSTRQTVSSTTQLKDLSQELKQTISKFKLEEEKDEEKTITNERPNNQ